MDKNLGNKAASGMVFKLLERTSVQVVALVVSILLARLLSPEDYGIIAMANVVIEILNVFVNYGLGTAIIHNKDADQEEISTCFWASLILGIVMYALIVCLAGPVSGYFEMPLLKQVIPVMGLQIVFAVINSVQVALIAKNFMFRQYFVIALAASVLSGGVGIVMANMGFGVWSLVTQALISIGLTTAFSAAVLRWKPKAVFSLKALKAQAAYSWRLLVVGIVDCIYAEMRNVIIAKKYSPEDLAYYNKGTQFPKLISNTVNQSVIAVLFPVMSMLQDDVSVVCGFIKQAVSALTFCLFPIMVGLLSVSESLVRILLTDKWIQCVPYMQILCVAYMITPVQSIYKQGLKALGRTQTLLVANMIEKITGIVLLVISIPQGVSAICWSFVLYHVVGLIVYMICGQIVCGYKVLRQVIDMLPNLFGVTGMACFVFAAKLIPLGLYGGVVLQILVGMVSYVLLAILTKNPNMVLVKNIIVARRNTNKTM